MQKAWQKTFEIILKTIKVLRKKTSSDGEMKTTAFTVIFHHMLPPTRFDPLTLFNLRYLEMEKCPVSGSPILKMERSMTKFFGIKTFGVHVNCYFRNPEGQICLWVGRRSPTKETWPGLLDNCFAGRSFKVILRSFSLKMF